MDISICKPTWGSDYDLVAPPMIRSADAPEDCLGHSQSFRLKDHCVVVVSDFDGLHLFFFSPVDLTLPIHQTFLSFQLQHNWLSSHHNRLACGDGEWGHGARSYKNKTKPIKKTKKKTLLLIRKINIEICKHKKEIYPRLWLTEFRFFARCAHTHSPQSGYVKRLKFSMFHSGAVLYH